MPCPGQLGLGAQCTDHWTTGQSRGVGVPAVQLTTHVAPCMVVWLYGGTSKFFWLDGLLLFCIIMGLCSASSTIIFELKWFMMFDDHVMGLLTCKQIWHVLRSTISMAFKMLVKKLWVEDTETLI